MFHCGHSHEKWGVRLIIKPFQNDDLLMSARKALNQKQLVQRVRVLENVLREKQRPQPLLGDSRQMNDVRTLIDQVAQTNYTVLIQGESGTGKELVAHQLQRHKPSSRRTVYSFGLWRPAGNSCGKRVVWP